MYKIFLILLLFIFSCDESEVDCAGIEDGDAVEDCAGECNGDAIEDKCGICNGDNSSCSINCTEGYSSIPNATNLDGVISGDYLDNRCYNNIFEKNI